jgi:hypothetical protein
MTRVCVHRPNVDAQLTETIDSPWFLLVSSWDEPVVAGENTAGEPMDMDPTNYLTRERERI